MWASRPHSYRGQWFKHPHHVGPFPSEIKWAVVSIETYPLIEDDPKKARDDSRALEINSASHRLVLAVFANRFDWAAFEGFHAQRDVVIRLGLLMHEGITSVFVTGEEIRSSFTAKITVDALLINIEFTLNILRPFFVYICHPAKIENFPCESSGKPAETHLREIRSFDCNPSRIPIL
jgi:hypothetical protein